jgi:putative PIN family toxin of toxin-antitoxin system
MESRKHPLRVVVDANVLISFLLYKTMGPIGRVVAAAFAGLYRPLLRPGLIAEVVRAVEQSRYLAARIGGDQIADFIRAWSQVAEAIPSGAPIVPVTRDPKDDYLLAYALWGEADLLVTGDEDLLTLRQVGRLRILSPRECAELLDRSQ